LLHFIWGGAFNTQNTTLVTALLERRKLAYDIKLGVGLGQE